MYILQASKFDKGDYTFSGKALTSYTVNLLLTTQEIENIKRQIQEFTKNRKVDYVLTFENEKGERILAFDNVSESEKQELRHAGNDEEYIESHNYYTLMLGN